MTLTLLKLYDLPNDHMRFTYQTGEQPLAGYTIQRGIHRGGFGEVYYAHSDGGKEVALKLLHDQDHETELRGVGQCLNLKHPNLVNIFDLKTDVHGDHWVVMEYVAGSSLEDVLASFPDGLPLGEVRDWLCGLVAGVAHLHERGIVHRDLKPANVYRENGVVKVGDVGLSKRLDSDNRRQHTQSVGTVYYMAPEVAQGKYGPEVDVYSLGVMLYELITGKLPFTGETTAEILMKHLTAQPDLNPIPKSLRPVLARALEKDPRNRTPTVRQLEQEFLRASGLASERQTSPASSSNNPEASPATNGYSKSNGHSKEDNLPWISVNVNRPLPRQFSPLPGSAAQPENNTAKSWLPAASIIFVILFLFVGPPRHSPRWIFMLPAFVLFSVLFHEFKGKRRAYQQANRTRESFQTMPETIRAAAARRATYDGRVAPSVSANDQPLPDSMPQSFRPISPSRRSSSERSIPTTKPWSVLIPELGASAGFAGLIASVLSLGVCLFLINGFQTPVMPSMEHATLFAAVSVVGSWLLLIGNTLTLKSSWTKRQRFAFRLLTGALLGTCAYALNQFLVVQMPANAYTIGAVVKSIGSHPLNTGVEPTWLGYVVFFAGWLGVRRWSRDMDPHRKKRFRVALTASSVVIGYIVSSVFEFPQWYAMVWAGTISTTVQLASTWTPIPLSRRGV